MSAAMLPAATTDSHTAQQQAEGLAVQQVGSEQHTPSFGQQAFWVGQSGPASEDTKDCCWGEWG